MKTCICGRAEIMWNTHKVGVTADNIVRYTVSSLTVLHTLCFYASRSNQFVQTFWLYLFEIHGINPIVIDYFRCYYLISYFTQYIHLDFAYSWLHWFGVKLTVKHIERNVTSHQTVTDLMQTIS